MKQSVHVQRKTLRGVASNRGCTHGLRLAFAPRSSPVRCSASDGRDGTYQGSGSGPDLTELASSIGNAWDPEGLLPPMDNASSDHFTRRIQIKAGQAAAAAASTFAAAEGARPAAASEPATSSSPPLRAAAAAAAQLPISPTPSRPAASPPAPQPASPPAQTPGMELIPADALLQGGLLPKDLTPEKRAELEFRLASSYMTVDLSTPGLRILCLDPPVFTVGNFYPDDGCDELVAAAEDTGFMQLSKIGGGNVASTAGANQYNDRRNSSGMQVDNKTLAMHPRLHERVSDFQSRGKVLLQAKRWRAWGKPGLMPRAGQYTYESAQVTRYESGQHFLSHEDGFHRALAEANGFQRSATLLLYLNTVPRGGCTRFEKLDLAVAPVKGKLLVFFPSKADGTADSRTLHTGEDAEDTTKHVIQQWVVCGWGALPAAAAHTKTSASTCSSSGSGAAGGQATAATAGAGLKIVSVVSVPASTSAAGADATKKARKGGAAPKPNKGFGKK
ncbi:hypothetical protein FOA52_002522 [Chlamydomonas sp. UWO 241]|nr:hypothetical protein FOA52_002522 [Chlamydomonas sp. UWO 241]